jgi:hypothetical protein
MPRQPRKKTAAATASRRNRPPATYEDIGRVLGLALRDTQFRNKLTKDPTAALKHENFGVGEKGVEFFKSLNTKKFVSAAEDYRKRVDNLGLASDMEV